MTTITDDNPCDCGNTEFFFVKDLNLDKAWKAGNMYSRKCVDCGARYFLAKSLWRDVSDQYVILDGEDEPVPIFSCPRCEERVTGQPSECPYCDAEYTWPEATPSTDTEEIEQDVDEDDAEFDTAAEIDDDEEEEEEPEDQDGETAEEPDEPIEQEA